MTMTRTIADKLLDRTNMPFGKYKGVSPERIARYDPGYVLWLYNTLSPRRCSRALALDCEAAIQDAADDRFLDMNPADD